MRDPDHFKLISFAKKQRAGHTFSRMPTPKEIRGSWCYYVLLHMVSPLRGPSLIQVVLLTGEGSPAKRGRQWTSTAVTAVH